MDNQTPGTRFALLPHADPDFFRLIPQAGVRHAVFPQDDPMNACYDIAAAPDGRVFFSQCAELGVAQCARLYEYSREENRFHRHFRLEDVTFQQPEAIRPSKIHTSMDFMEDGRLICATHTTAKAPQHPTWLPFAYYRHQFEGYQGSNILMYDYRTGAVENRGIPVPFETIYGGAYDPGHRAYYFSGMMRGHFYRFDLGTNEVRDLGQGTEEAVYKLTRGPDGHIYSTTRLGRLFRLNTDTQAIEDLGLQIPGGHPQSSYTSRLQLSFSAWHPDGKLYFGVFKHPDLFCYDPVTNRLEDLGPAACDYDRYPQMNNLEGLCCDSRGVLWYGVVFQTGCSAETGARLYSWDIRSGRRACYGFVGSPLRTLRIIAEMCVCDDVLYIADSNYDEFAPAGVLSVDIRSLEEGGAESPVPAGLAEIYMGAGNGRALYPGGVQRYDEAFAALCRSREAQSQAGDFARENQDTFACQEAVTCKLWQRVGAEHSAVRALRWEDDRTLKGICGSGPYYRFTLTDGALTALEPAADYRAEAPDLSAYDGLRLPAVPGRQYKAVATAAQSLADGAVLVGTQDGMAALVRDGQVFSLGQAAPYGPIHAMSADAAGRKVYGVASYPKDLGSVFSFSMTEGLRWEGRLSFFTGKGDYTANSCEPTTVAVSPDGRWVAFGVVDRLGTVYLCRVADSN